MRRVGWFYLLSIVAPLAACASPSAHPPGIESRCDGSSCGIHTPISGGGVDAGAGDSGTARSVQVEIKELYDTIYRNAQPFQGKVQISALDSQGVPLSEDYDTADAPKNLELLSTTSLWVTVTPVPSGSQDLVTYQNVDTTKLVYPPPPILTLYVANASLVADILYGLVPPQWTEANAGQVLVFFVDAAGVGVANVAVTLLTGAPPLYTEGGVWGAGSATDTSGQALLPNVPVFDGGVASLSYTVGGAAASDAGYFAPVSFPVAAGAVTLLTVVIR